MTIGILGKKLGMTQLFQADGTWVPVTVVQAGPCKVLQVKSKDVAELPESDRTAATSRGKKRGKLERARYSDGYYGVQLGFDDRPERTSTKPQIGHCKKAGSAPKRFVRELRCEELPTCKRGDDVTVAILKDVPRVDVSGVSKGRGFAGTIKRYGFHRQAASHGNSVSTRKLGGTGRTNSVSKGVPKGKKMPGHMGCDNVTVQNLEVVRIDEERNLLYLRGAVPGHRHAYVIVRKTLKT